MKADEFPNAKHLCVIPSRSRIQSLDYCTYITEDTGVHERCGEIKQCFNAYDNEWKQPTKMNVYLQPTNITQMVNIFSPSVFGATFPNPTDVKLLKVKYRAVMYRDWKQKKGNLHLFKKIPCLDEYLKISFKVIYSISFVCLRLKHCSRAAPRRFCVTSW